MAKELAVFYGYYTTEERQFDLQFPTSGVAVSMGFGSS
jgi:hypothetical protein